MFYTTYFYNMCPINIYERYVCDYVMSYTAFYQQWPSTWDYITIYILVIKKLFLNIIYWLDMVMSVLQIMCTLK